MMNNLSFISKEAICKYGNGEPGGGIRGMRGMGVGMRGFTIIHKTFEINSSFQVKQRTTGKV